jgi:hypothetical protein
MNTEVKSAFGKTNIDSGIFKIIIIGNHIKVYKKVRLLKIEKIFDNNEGGK